LLVPRPDREGPGEKVYVFHDSNVIDTCAGRPNPRRGDHRLNGVAITVKNRLDRTIAPIADKARQASRMPMTLGPGTNAAVGMAMSIQFMCAVLV